MKKIFFLAMLLILIGCGKEFEPDLSGWKSHTIYSKRLVLDIDGQEKTVMLPGDNLISYRYAQWTKQNRILLLQIIETESCYDYQILSVDTTGVIMDTVFTASPNTALNFKLAPNDSILLLKTYSDNCEGSDNFKYTFYDRFLKTPLSDSITVWNSRGIPLEESIWSPDSKQVIIQTLKGRRVKAFTYSLETKDTAFIDTGSNFIWSPTDDDVIAYIKDYSLYFKNMKTGEVEIIYEGKSRKLVEDFRWNPTGDFLKINLKSYLLNVEAGPFQRHTMVFLSLPERVESERFYREMKFDSWKNVPSN